MNPNVSGASAFSRMAECHNQVMQNMYTNWLFSIKDNLLGGSMERVSSSKKIVWFYTAKLLVSPVSLCFRALEDIEESIKELKYYRQVIFKTCNWPHHQLLELQLEYWSVDCWCSIQELFWLFVSQCCWQTATECAAFHFMTVNDIILITDRSAVSCRSKQLCLFYVSHVQVQKYILDLLVA